MKTSIVIISILMICLAVWAVNESFSPEYGLFHKIFSISLSLFFVGFFIWVYKKFKEIEKS